HITDRSQVKPSARLRRRREVLRLYHLEPPIAGVHPRGTELFEDLSVAVIHAPEAAELALHAVPIAVVVAVLGRELAAGKRVEDLDSRHDLHGERERRLPARLGPLLVRQKKAYRGCIAHTGDRTHVIAHFH